MKTHRFPLSVLLLALAGALSPSVQAAGPVGQHL